MAHRIQLDAHAERADRLFGLDECATHVVVAHETLAIADAALRRISDRSRNTGIWHRHHQVRIGRMLDCQPLAHLVAGLVHRMAKDQRIRPSKIDVLEDAHRMRPLGKRV